MPIDWQARGSRSTRYEKSGEESLGLIFLKGYQWPFDTRKLDGSSKVDILVAEEIKKGNRVFLDFTKNPKGLESEYDILPKEAYDYLDRSGALFGTPIERLAKMNIGAIELYAEAIAPFTHHIHVFQWKDNERFSLNDGVKEWQKYYTNFPLHVHCCLNLCRTEL